MLIFVKAEWKCVATNDYGQSVTSCFLKLAIPRHYKKPRFLENLRAVLSEEGAVNLECKVWKSISVQSQLNLQSS